MIAHDLRASFDVGVANTAISDHGCACFAGEFSGMVVGVFEPLSELLCSANYLRIYFRHLVYDC